MAESWQSIKTGLEFNIRVMLPGFVACVRNPDYAAMWF